MIFSKIARIKWVVDLFFFVEFLIGQQKSGALLSSVEVNHFFIELPFQKMKSDHESFKNSKSGLKKGRGDKYTNLR